MKRKSMSLSKKIVTMCLGLIVIMGVGSTFALLSSGTQLHKNNFNGANVNIAIVENSKEEHEDYLSDSEEYTKLTKKGDKVEKTVTILNKANDSYVRVRLIPVIKDDQGNTLGKDVQLTLTFKTGTAWKINDDGTYYYSKVLEEGKTSDVLLDHVQLEEDLPSGYHLELKVIADSIGARPATQLLEAWGIENFDNMKNVQ